jgi:hypothetical protein
LVITYREPLKWERQRTECARHRQPTRRCELAMQAIANNVGLRIDQVAYLVT